MERPGVYILQSSKNGNYYIGSTSDIITRIDYHNKGRVKATKNLRPWILLSFIPRSSIVEAKNAEYRLKQYKRRDIIEKVIHDKLFPWEYTTPI